MTPLIRIQEADFNLAGEMAAMAVGRQDIGAMVSFTGLCRSEGSSLNALELQHYPGMAEDELARVAEEARLRWPLLGVTIIHRVGRIPVGDNIVLVLTASAHRRAAFEAAEFMMDYLKTRAPFWKRVHHADGREGEWVDAKESDDLDASRWK